MKDARWSAEMRRRQDKAGITSVDLARLSGMDKGMVSRYRCGDSLPRVGRAAILAEILDAPMLLSLCVELRTKTCEECDATFVSDGRGGNEKRWCSKECGDRYRVRVRYPSERHWNGQRYDTWKRIAQKLRTSVEAMCRACEPDATCRDSVCPLRNVSPFPLVELKLRVG